jgi:hypothetical protein
MEQRSSACVCKSKGSSKIDEQVLFEKLILALRECERERKRRLEAINKSDGERAAFLFQYQKRGKRDRGETLSRECVSGAAQ